MEGSVQLRRNGVCQLLLVASFLLVLVLPACGGQSSGAHGPSGGDVPSGGSMGRSGGTEFATSSGDVAVVESGAQAETASVQATAQTLPDDFDRKIVKTAELGIRAENVRESADDAQRIAAGFGGNVLSSRVSRGDDSLYANLTLSVPASDFEAALDELRGLGKKVTDDAVSGEDVTEEFVDLESRERNLLAAEASLLDLYDKAVSVDDTLTIQRELTNVRGEIELVQGRIEYLEQRTAFSRITLSIEPTPGPKPSPPAWNPADAAARAWEASLGVLQGFATVLISALVFGWWLVPVLVTGLLLWKRRSREVAATDSPRTP